MVWFTFYKQRQTNVQKIPSYAWKAETFVDVEHVFYT